MGSFIIALKTVLPLFLIIFAGLIFSKTKAASETWVDILNKYALWIGFPALVIASLMNLEVEGESYLKLILLNSAYIVISMLLAFPVARIFKLSKRMRSSLFLVFSFGNVAYLGIPVLFNAFGTEVLPTAAILSAVYLFWLLTLGIILIESNSKKEIDIKKIGLNLVKNPLLISIFIGLLIVFFKLKLPMIFEETINLFSNSVTAVVLFSLGIFLGFNKVGHPGEWIQVFIFAVLTMLVLPFIYYLSIKQAGLDSMQFDASILDASMPLGVTPYALAVQYKLETTVVARIVVLATSLSIFTIPLWMVVLS
ncbi:AEC family transporter [Maribellus maritimus]|uniref:AEC family transporter n=1 Tax=Maribellus maritimus TaxID=2870838 RepID=UPI001EEB3CA4|nr:AEC family transporter [Maribellus maritimus]MCG6189430.1 AEC family transporter [Maribellus maritimus]